MSQLKETPQQMVVDGRISGFGVFSEPFRRVNLLDADIPGIPRFLRKYRLKEWQHVAVLGQEVLMAFVIVLSFSRRIFLRFFLDAGMSNFLRGHEAAFLAWQGLPRILLYDNLKSAVLERQGQAIRFHPTLLDFAAHYRFEPRPVAIARGNEKGRVERAIRRGSTPVANPSLRGARAPLRPGRLGSAGRASAVGGSSFRPRRRPRAGRGSDRALLAAVRGPALSSAARWAGRGARGCAAPRCGR